MSHAYRQRKKNKKRARTEEEKSIAQKIRNGQMPRSYFAKSGDSKLERKQVVITKGFRSKEILKLTWRLIGTYNSLTKDLK